MVIVRSKIEWLNLAGYKGYAINPYVGCANACKYCWSRLLKHIPDKDWQKPRLARDFDGTTIAAMIAREYPRNERSNILLSASTDLFQPDYLGYDGIVTEILRGLSWVPEHREMHANIFILTKSGSFVRWLDELKDLKAKIGITLTNAVGNNEWEPNADESWVRTLALRMAKEEGLLTFISIEPWIPEITDPFEIIQSTQEFTDIYIIGSLNYFEVSKGYYIPIIRRIMNQLRYLGKPFFLKRELKKRCEFSSEEMEEVAYAEKNFQDIFYQS